MVNFWNTYYNRWLDLSSLFIKEVSDYKSRTLTLLIWKKFNEFVWYTHHWNANLENTTHIGFSFNSFHHFFLMSQIFLECQIVAISFGDTSNLLNLTIETKNLYYISSWSNLNLYFLKKNIKIKVTLNLNPKE